MMGLLIIWIALCILTGWIAAEKGRSGLGFFLLAFFLSPLIGILAAFGAQRHEEATTIAAAPETSRSTAPAVSGEQAISTGQGMQAFFVLLLIGLWAVIIGILVAAIW